MAVRASAIGWIVWFRDFEGGLRAESAHKTKTEADFAVRRLLGGDSDIAAIWVEYSG